MPRTARLLLDGGIYHVLTRGNNGQTVFHDRADCQRYLQLLAAYKAEHQLRLYHFALMPNHTHLIIEVPFGPALSKAMLGLNLSYALFYRKRYRYAGHLWQGRFKSLLIDRDSYLLECGRYVELNPVRAGLVQKPEAYPWSSYRVYAEGLDNPLVDQEPFYETLGATLQGRQRRYQHFVQEGLLQTLPEGFTNHRFIGSPTFVKRLEARLGLSAVKRPRGRPKKIGAQTHEK